MPDGPTSGLMRRLAKAPAPLTPERALRLAMTRAAERSIGLPLAVLALREEEGALDGLLSRLESGLLLLALRQDGAAAGLVALDGEARAAAIEVQALGRVADSPAPAREVTAADAALARPLLDSFLREAEEAVQGTPFAGWLRSPTLGDRIPSPREVPMRLADGRYRAVRLTLDLGAGGRQGLLLLLARLPDAAGPAAPGAPGATVAPQVLRAEAQVDAVLARLRLSLGEAGGLEPGRVIPLPGVTVASVRLEASGIPLGPARLGQVAGMRAVRIEVPLAPSLAPIPSLRDPDSADSLLPAAGPWAGAVDRPDWPALDGVDGTGWPTPDAAGGAGDLAPAEGGDAWPALPPAFEGAD